MKASELGPDKYVYHGTGEDRVESIKMMGLQPNEFGNPLNFHGDLEVARDYYGAGGGAVFRILKSKLPVGTRFDKMTNHYWTQRSVPPGDLEIWTSHGWSALSDAR